MIVSGFLGAGASNQLQHHLPPKGKKTKQNTQIKKGKGREEGGNKRKVKWKRGCKVFSTH